MSVPPSILETLKLGISVQLIPLRKGSEEFRYEFHYYAITPWGGENIYFSEKKIAEVLRNKHNIDGFLLGLTSEQYEEWIENNGQVRCSALTVKGKRCKAFVKGTYQASADVFRSLQGHYCVTHDQEADAHP